jgi:hypothetical protein
MILDRNPYIYFDSSTTDARRLLFRKNPYFKGRKITCSEILSWEEGNVVIGPNEMSYWDDTDRNT